MKRLTGFHHLVGYSDHTDGIEAAVGAAWLGACMVEKHFTLVRTSAGPDHAFSADPVQWRALCQQVRSAERVRGNGHITDVQPEMRVLARRSVVAARALVPGEIITDDALAYKRPGDGLPPAARDRLVGRTVTRRLASDEQFREGDWA